MLMSRETQHGSVSLHRPNDVIRIPIRIPQARCTRGKQRNMLKKNLWTVKIRTNTVGTFKLVHDPLRIPVRPRFVTEGNNPHPLHIEIIAGFEDGIENGGRGIVIAGDGHNRTGGPGGKGRLNFTQAAQIIRPVNAITTDGDDVDISTSRDLPQRRFQKRHRSKALSLTFRRIVWLHFVKIADDGNFHNEPRRNVRCETSKRNLSKVRCLISAILALPERSAPAEGGA